LDGRPSFIESQDAAVSAADSGVSSTVSAAGVRALCTVQGARRRACSLILVCFAAGGNEEQAQTIVLVKRKIVRDCKQIDRQTQFQQKISLRSACAHWHFSNHSQHLAMKNLGERPFPALQFII
jgi:hypothetical protein